MLTEQYDHLMRSIRAGLEIYTLRLQRAMEDEGLTVTSSKVSLQSRLGGSCYEIEVDAAFAFTRPCTDEDVVSGKEREEIIKLLGPIFEVTPETFMGTKKISLTAMRNDVGSYTWLLMYKSSPEFLDYRYERP